MLWDNEELLLGQNYKHFRIFATFRGMLVTHPLQVDNSITNKSPIISETYRSI
jgi:hypothetical protein